MIDAKKALAIVAAMLVSLLIWIATTIIDDAYDRLDQLEKRVRELERRLDLAEPPSRQWGKLLPPPAVPR